MIISKVIYYDYFQATMKGHLQLFYKVQHTLLKLPQFLKRHSVSIVSNTTKNCECLAAYKARRGQQMFTFYNKLWGEARFKSVVSQLRQKLMKQLAERCRALLLTSFSICLFDWNTKRISQSDLEGHYADIDHIKKLTEMTMTCTTCNQRLIVDIPVDGIQYCMCKDSGSVYNKKFKDSPWRPFIERTNLLVWRKENITEAGLYEYKLFGSYNDVRADVFLKVQVDTEYRKIWDPTAVEIKVISSEPDTNSDLIYWEMMWPTFFSNRDYVFVRRYAVDPVKNIIVISNQSSSDDCIPEHPDKVRVTDYWCTMVIKPSTTFDQPGIEFCMTYFDNPGLSIPSAVQTWVATSAMPDFLEKLRLASTRYTDEYVSSSRNISPWPDNFVMPHSEIITGQSDVEIKTVDSIDDIPLFRFYLDAFCLAS